MCFVTVAVFICFGSLYTEANPDDGAPPLGSALSLIKASVFYEKSHLAELTRHPLFATGKYRIKILGSIVYS